MAWNKILNKEKSESGSENVDCKTIKETVGILSYEAKELNEWLNSKVYDIGYQSLNDDEIHDGKAIEENENEISENNPGPSYNEAFEFFETAMKWLEWQKFFL